MARLTLEKTMQTSFKDIADISSNNAFHDYTRRIKLLADSNRLRKEDISELIDPQEDASDIIDSVARIALSETVSDKPLYLPGYTAVVAYPSGKIIGVQEKPNDIPKLQSYGPSLLWAMLKIGHESFAATRAWGSASEVAGYRTVHRTLTNKRLEDVPYENRHHIGGKTLPHYFYPSSPSMRRFEHTLLHAGVSGVVATDSFRELASGDLRTANAAAEAQAKPDILDGFVGNMFAGSLDSTLGSVILSGINNNEANEQFTDTALTSIARRHAVGINVH